MTVQWCNGAMTQNEEMKNANVRALGVRARQMKKLHEFWKILMEF